MPKLGKNLHMCFTKLTFPPGTQSSPLKDADHSRQSLLIKNFYDYNPTKQSDSDSYSEPDFASVVAAQRFFFPSPGRSNSIVESTPSVSTTPESSSDQSNSNSKKIMSFSCAEDSCSTEVVLTESPDLYMDFRRSMQEMVESRDLVDVKANWDCLHELLLCYLTLNPKTTHDFIISAFDDLLVTLMSPPETDN